MATIHVSLDINATPPVTCSPAKQNMNRGKDNIHWKQAANQNFTFASLTGLPNPPFTPQSFSDDEIIVSDDNQNNGPEIAYSYTLCVLSNGLTYCTGPGTTLGNGNPTVNNK